MIEFVGIYPSSALKSNALDHGPIWEIMYCTEGSGTFVSGDAELYFTKGDIIIQPPHSLHYFSPDTACTTLYIMLNDEFPFPGVFRITDNPDGDIQTLMMLLYRLSLKDVAGKSSVMMLLTSTLLEFITMIKSQNSRSRIVDVMENEIILNISNPAFRMQSMYEKLYIHEDRARARFMEEVGCTPHQRLTQLRMQQACFIFTQEKGDASISEVALRVGIPDPQYFSRVFKKFSGLSPVDWINQNVRQRGKSK